MSRPLSIYVGCALKHATEEYKDSIRLLKDRLSELDNVKVLEFVVNQNATPREIYENDIEGCVASCDFMIAEFSYPSTGLGYEVSVMIEKLNKPVFGFAHKDAVVSSLIVGIKNKNFSFCTYSDMDEVLDIVKEKISSIG